MTYSYQSDLPCPPLIKYSRLWLSLMVCWCRGGRKEGKRREGGEGEGGEGEGQGLVDLRISSRRLKTMLI